MLETGRVRKDRPPRVFFPPLSRSLFPRMAANVTKRGVSSLLVIDARSKVCRAAGCNDRSTTAVETHLDSILPSSRLQISHNSSEKYTYEFRSGNPRNRKSRGGEKGSSCTALRTRSRVSSSSSYEERLENAPKVTTHVGRRSAESRQW